MLLASSILKLYLSLHLFVLPLTNKDVSLIEKLQENESLTIRMESSGCFHHTIDILIISKTKDNYIAKYKDQTKTLNNKNLKFYKAFEKRLIQFKEYPEMGCTTVDKYYVSSPSFEDSYTDGSCQWDGFRNLTENIFGK